MNAVNPISHSELKVWLESLPNPAELEQQALTECLYRMELVQRFVGQHPEQSSTPAGRVVCMALRDFWRSAYMQRNFSPRLKRVWNTFFILEAAYFYPATVTSLFPGSLNELGALLCDKQYLAELVADGDVGRAKEIASEHSAFWEAVIPYDEVPSPQTLSSRRDAAIEKLVKDLNRQLELITSLPNSSTDSMPIPDEQTSAIQEVEHLISAQDTTHEIATVSYRPRSLETSEPAFLPQPRTLLLRYQEQVNSRVALGALSVRFLAWPHGDEVSPSDLDAIAVNLDIANLMTRLGVRPTVERLERWGEDRGFLKAIMERFATCGDDDIRLQCAACLRHIQLSKIVEIEVNLRSQFWKVKRLSALESIARIALDLREDEFTRSLAEAILGQETYVEQLWNLGKLYAPLAHKLTITLGKYLYYDEHSGQLRLGGQ